MFTIVVDPSRFWLSIEYTIECSMFNLFIQKKSKEMTLVHWVNIDVILWNMIQYRLFKCIEHFKWSNYEVWLHLMP